MLCCTALVKSPLALTPFVDLTIDESSETLAKLIVTARQKLSPSHYFTSLSIRVSVPPNLHKSIAFVSAFGRPPPQSPKALLNIANTTIDNITKFENNQPLEKLAD